MIAKFVMTEYEDRIEFRPTIFGWLFRNKVRMDKSLLPNGFAFKDTKDGSILYEKKSQN